MVVGLLAMMIGQLWLLMLFGYFQLSITFDFATDVMMYNVRVWIIIYNGECILLKGNWGSSKITCREIINFLLDKLKHL